MTTSSPHSLDRLKIET